LFKLLTKLTGKLIKYFGIFYIFGIMLNLIDKSKLKKNKKDSGNKK